MELFTKQNLQRLRTNTFYKKPKTETLTSKIHVQKRSIKNYNLKTGHSMLKCHKSRIDPDTEPTCDQCKVVETLYHYLLHCKQFEQLRSKIMKNISYIFNTSVTTFKNTLVKLLGEDTLANDNSNKVKEEIAHFIDKTKKRNLTLFNHVNIVYNFKSKTLI